MSMITNSGRAQQLLIYIRSSLWFVPALLVLCAVMLAIGFIALDLHLGSKLRDWLPQLFATNAEGARSILSAIATSMATVAGVVFSITIVALALASSQYSPRVLRNFMRDRANQTVLGVFVGVYLYCLLVLRAIQGGESAFVPSAAVVGALVLAVLAMGFFIFFIHHISSTIQASEMVDGITRETLAAIDRLFPTEMGNEDGDVTGVESPQGSAWYTVPAREMGYVQGVDSKALIEFARRYHTIVRMECAIGDFVAEGWPLASLTLERAPDSDMAQSINRIFAVGTYRTIDQDAAFGIRQLVDISLKALSPGINDTTTAVTCIEHLSVLLARCARRGMADVYRYDGDTLRVIARRPDFPQLVAMAFNQILESAEGNTEIMICMLGAIERVAGASGNRRRIDALQRQVNAIEEVSRRTVKSGNAREDIEHALTRVKTLLGGKAARY